MDHSTSFPPQDYTPHSPQGKTMEYWIDIGEDSPEYHDIQVFHTHGDFSSPDMYGENVAAMRERKKTSNLLKVGNSHVKSASILDPEVLGKVGSNKKRSKLDPAMSSVNALHQLKRYSEHCLHDRMGQGSMSEPTLCNAKDRGDSITLQEFYRDGGNSHCFGDGRTKAAKSQPGIGGCIYVMSEGKVYKSKIETRDVQVVEDSPFNNLLQGKHNKTSLSLRKRPDGSISSKTYGRSGRHQCSKEEPGEFEIAIFLSGVRNVIQKTQKKHRKLDDYRNKDDDCKAKQERRAKRKKKNARKNETTVLGKQFEIGGKTYHIPSKMLTIDPYIGKKGFTKEQLVRSRLQLKFSSESESDHGRLDKTPNSIKRLRNVPENVTSLRAIEPNECKTPDTPACKRNEIVSYRFKGTPHSSYYQLSDVYRTPKRKIPEKELWAKFETVFRAYASTTRHSGEVIPRKISTEWMTNTGVVDEIMTEKEADDAFRQAAGAKITMNAQEYKDFLIGLTLRMKLPYYEIYRRMCGI